MTETVTEKLTYFKEKATYNGDSNNDGITDADTKQIFSGVAKLADGTPVISRLAHKPTFTEFQAGGSDYDDDELRNDAELVKTYTYAYDYNNSPLCTKEYWAIRSNPFMKDTDGDGLDDNEDPLKNKYGMSSLMSVSYKNELTSRIDNQIKTDFNWIMENKNIGYYSTQDCIDVIYEYDELITELSNKYLLPKASIQSILLREMRCYDVRDDLVDIFVIQQYAYLDKVERYNNAEWWQQILMDYPVMPTPYIDDSSTGYGQIFAKTAINANNWAIDQKLITGEKYNFNIDNERKEIWGKLKYDNNYNISMIPIILMWGISDRGYGMKYWSYNEEQIKKLLAIYQGTDQYGDEVYNCYMIFDYYNQMDNLRGN